LESAEGVQHLLAAAGPRQDRAMSAVDGLPIPSAFMEMGAQSGAKTGATSGARTKTAVKRAGDGMPVRATRETGLVEEADSSADGIDYGYGHHTVEDDQQATSRASNKQHAAEDEAMSSMRFSETKERQNRAHGGKSLVNTPAAGGMDAYNKDTEVNKEEQWEQEARPPVAGNSVSPMLPRFAEVRSIAQRAPAAHRSVPAASDEDSVFSGYEGRRRELHGEQALATQDSDAPVDAESNPTPPSVPSDLPRFKARSEELVSTWSDRSDLSDHRPDSSENLAEETHDALFGSPDMGTEAPRLGLLEQQEQNQEQDMQRGQPSAVQGRARRNTAQRKVSEPRFQQQQQTFPVVTSSLDEDMRRVASVVPRSHHAFKSLSRSLSKVSSKASSRLGALAGASAGASSSIALHVSAQALSGGVQPAATPYNEEPMPTPSDGDRKAIAGFGKPTYDNTHPGAREHPMSQLGGGLADGTPEVLHASPSRSEDDLRRMRFKKLVFGKSSKLMERADSFRRHGLKARSPPQWHGWVEKAQKQRHN